nr:hypothetical protein [Enterovibrio nigricans]
MVRQSQFKWIGKQDAKADCRYWSAEIDVPMEDIDRLQDLEYYLKEKGAPLNTAKSPYPINPDICPREAYKFAQAYRSRPFTSRLTP